MAAAAKTMAPAPSAQKREVEQAHKASRLKLGDRYYVLSQKWWAAWRDHVAYDDGGEGLERLRLNSDDAPAPGPIGNEPLGIRVRGELVLREGLVERDDYALVCAAVWRPRGHRTSRRLREMHCSSGRDRGDAAGRDVDIPRGRPDRTKIDGR